MGLSPDAGTSSGGAQPQEPALDSQSAGHDAETVLFFVDLEDSTPLWESDPEAMKPAIARFEQLIDEAVEGAGGKAFKATGDGKLATMPTVQTAADAAETFIRSMATEDWGSLGELRARVAIDVGVTEARAGDHFGPTMNRAGRLMSLGHGGQVLLSAAAKAVLSDQRKTIDLGEHRLKGVGRPQKIFQLVVDGMNNEFPPLRGHSGGGPTTRSGFGRAIRGFELREEIGAGDFGVVYRAFQTSVGREVAIKVIRPEYANQPVFVKRFEAEAQFVAQLEHPHIVSLYDYWRDPDGAYVVMRYLRGGSLQHSLRRGPWNETEALRLLEQIGGALSYSHRQGVVHRDLKPANVLLDPDGNAYLSDFGIATRQADPAGDVVASSPVYVAPEERRGDPLTPQSDIFGLGILTFEILTGVRPTFDGALPSVLEARPALSPTIDQVLRKATATEPQSRHERVEDFLRDLRQALGADVVGAASLAAETAVADALTAPRNPYKGLRAFGEVDAADFFGREPLIELLAAETGRSRLVAVVGPSGSGKSSLVKAGLIPALRSGAVPGSREWLFTDMYPGSYPFEELEAALLRVAIGDPGRLIDELGSDDRGILRVSKQILPHDDSQLVLVIDQFEELFSMVYDDAVRELFLDSLVRAVTDERSRLHVVLTLRADFFHRPLEYKEFGDLLKTGIVSVTPPGDDQLALAIVQPARNAGLELEPGLAIQIVQDVSGQPGALPLMQYALSELYRHREGSLLTSQGYQVTGGVGGAVGNRADEIYESFDDTGRDAARQLFLRLVTVDDDATDTRRRVAQAELKGLDVDQEALDAVVQEFGANRLLGFDRDPHSRGPTVEVAHEALLNEWARLRHWIDEKREDIVLQRRLAVAINEWLEAGRDPSYLLSGGRLAQFATWAAGSDLVLTDVESGFLAESQRQEDRRAATTRWRRVAIAGSQTVLAIVAIVFAVFAWDQGNKVEDLLQQVATGQLPIAELQAQLDVDGGVIGTPVGDLAWGHVSGDEETVPAVANVVAIPGGYAALEGGRAFPFSQDLGFSYWTSGDGLAWKAQSLPFDGQGRSAELNQAGGDYWIVTADPAEIWISSDGTSWEKFRAPSGFGGEFGRVYESGGEIWLSSSAGLWMLSRGSWSMVFDGAQATPRTTGMTWTTLPGDVVSVGGTGIVHWTSWGVLPFEEILAIEEGTYDEFSAFWDPGDEAMIVFGDNFIGITSGSSEELARWNVETTATGVALRDAETDEVVHEVLAEEMAPAALAQIVKNAVYEPIVVIGTDGSSSQLVPPWNLSIDFGSPQIVAAGNRYLAFVSDQSFETGTVQVEVWSSSGGEVWENLGPPGFIQAGDDVFFSHVELQGDAFFATVDGVIPTHWVSHDGVEWAEIREPRLGWGQFAQLGTSWVFWGEGARFQMHVSSDGLNWIPVDTSAISITAAANGDSFLDASTVGNSLFFFLVLFDESGTRNTWVLTLDG